MKKNKFSSDNKNTAYNRSNFENRNIKLEMNLTLHDVRLLSKYLENELVPTLDNLLTQLNFKAINQEKTLPSEEVKFYTYIFNIFNELAEITYGKMVKEEKNIIDELKEDKIPINGILGILADKPDDEQRITNIYKAIDDLELEENEALDLEKKLPTLTRNILRKLDSDVNSLYIPLVTKLISFLKNSTRDYSQYLGKAIFSEGALEEILELDFTTLDIFLSKLTKVKVTIGEVEGYIIEDFSIYNNDTVIVHYPIFITNPEEYQKHFLPLNDKEIKVKFEI